MRASSTEAGRPGLLGRLDPLSERRTDGTTLVRAAQALPPYRARLIDHLHEWAERAPDRTFLAERRADRSWRRLTYAEASEQVVAVAGGLLALGLSEDRPIAILGGNDIEHALLALAAMEVGIPYCPVSPAYSLVSKDFGKLRDAFALLTPGLVFVPDGAAFAAAIEAVGSAGVVRVATRRGEAIGAVPFEALADGTATARSAVAGRRELVGPDTIAKFLLTSGSTGHPKAVVNTQRMLSANQTMLAQCFPFLSDEPPVFVDWLPWNHTFGSNHNFGMTLVHGGSLFIDAGKPMPGAIAETVANLREIAPTAYFNVPKGYEALLPHLRADEALRATFFSRLRMLFYAGAGLSQAVWDAYQDLAVAATGARIPFVTGLGATETAPSALMNLRDVDGPGNMGHPMVGVVMKLVPAAGKLEVRIKADCVTPGYWRSPELTAAAFDEEGYYRLGDAVRYASPGDADGGFLFDGRISEDFKLATGTWVSVGPLRAAFLAAFHPLARDVVIAGHDRDDIAVLVFPDLDACRAVADGSADPVGHPAVRAVFAERLVRFAEAATGSSTRVERLALLAEPPSIDRGEITDKGSINQRAVLAARGGLVADLYADPPPAHVISARATVAP
ncbi:feruloyl-CoA synthase [Prosthecomicrobium sp. N25]|uniref:feruloyl-CoA synthase n=1 Tax=Prosthecomicrobium sp. N25 TaxID=3129254 RepID=UPI0030775201